MAACWAPLISLMSLSRRRRALGEQSQGTRGVEPLSQGTGWLRGSFSRGLGVAPAFPLRAGRCWVPVSPADSGQHIPARWYEPARIRTGMEKGTQTTLLSHNSEFKDGFAPLCCNIGAYWGHSSPKLSSPLSRLPIIAEWFSVVWMKPRSAPRKCLVSFVLRSDTIKKPPPNQPSLLETYSSLWHYCVYSLNLNIPNPQKLANLSRTSGRPIATIQ